MPTLANDLEWITDIHVELNNFANELNGAKTKCDCCSLLKWDDFDQGVLQPTVLLVMMGRTMVTLVQFLGVRKEPQESRLGILCISVVMVRRSSSLAPTYSPLLWRQVSGSRSEGSRSRP